MNKEFFGIENICDTPTKNHPNYAFMSTDEHRQTDRGKFVDKFISGDEAGDNSIGILLQVTTPDPKISEILQWDLLL